MGGEVSQGGTYPYGSKVVITALPNEGYVFDRWLEDGMTDIIESSTFHSNNQRS